MFIFLIFLMSCQSRYFCFYLPPYYHVQSSVKRNLRSIDFQAIDQSNQSLQFVFFAPVFFCNGYVYIEEQEVKVFCSSGAYQLQSVRLLRSRSYTMQVRCGFCFVNSYDVGLDLQQSTCERFGTFHWFFLLFQKDLLFL